MSAERFDELLSRLLDDELSLQELDELSALVRAEPARRELLAEQLEASELIAQAADELRKSPLFITAVASRLEEETFVSGVCSRLAESSGQINETSAYHGDAGRGGSPPPRRRMAVPIPWAISAVAVAGLVSSWFLLWPRTDPGIATITDVSGPLQWTGDGGQVVYELQVGDRISGGTVDGLSPESWFALEFDDGSTMTLSGNSMLVISNEEQKELHLKSGTLAASVVPQPEGKPMLVHTWSALLTVVGTSFEVEADIVSTGLTVTEGEVHLKRLSDGQTLDVTANQRAVAAADRELVAELQPEPVHFWKSDLSHGPEATNFGRWMPPTADKPASLKAVAFVPRENQSVALQMVGLPVSWAEHAPVVIKPNSRFVLRGRLDEPTKLYFGFRVAHSSGERATMFRTRPVSAVQPVENIEVVFHLDQFQHDPSPNNPKTAESPEGLLLMGVWCFTVNPVSTGLQITEVELIPPDPRGGE